MSSTLLRSLLSSLALIGLLYTPASPAGVDRETMLSEAEARKWRGVGRVNISNTRRRGMCTGTLIAPDIVLTAAHCVTHPRTGKPYALRHIHFVAGWHKGKSSGHSQAGALAIHPDWSGGMQQRFEDLSSDLALIRLATPLEPDEAMPFDLDRPPLPGDPLTLISYRRDRPHALTRQGNCPYKSIIGQVLELECPVTYGASGAPIFLQENGRQKVVAVLSAMGDDGAPQAFAVRADNVVEMLRELLP